jgi:hypothetical protein
VNLVGFKVKIPNGFVVGDALVKGVEESGLTMAGTPFLSP